MPPKVARRHHVRVKPVLAVAALALAALPAAPAAAQPAAAPTPTAALPAAAAVPTTLPDASRMISAGGLLHVATSAGVAVYNPDGTVRSAPDRAGPAVDLATDGTTVYTARSNTAITATPAAGGTTVSYPTVAPPVSVAAAGATIAYIAGTPATGYNLYSFAAPAPGAPTPAPGSHRRAAGATTVKPAVLAAAGGRIISASGTSFADVTAYTPDGGSLTDSAYLPHNTSAGVVDLAANSGTVTILSGAPGSRRATTYTPDLQYLATTPTLTLGANTSGVVTEPASTTQHAAGDGFGTFTSGDTITATHSFTGTALPRTTAWLPETATAYTLVAGPNPTLVADRARPSLPMSATASAGPATVSGTLTCTGCRDGTRATVTAAPYTASPATVTVTISGGKAAYTIDVAGSGLVTATTTHTDLTSPGGATAPAYYVQPGAPPSIAGRPGTTIRAFNVGAGRHHTTGTLTAGGAHAGNAAVFACGDPLPSTSTTNWPSGGQAANTALTVSDDNGWICVIAPTGATTTWTATGLWPVAEARTFTSPRRIADTRTTGSPVASGGTLEVVTGPGLFYVNTTVVAPTGRGRTTLWDCTTLRPLVSAHQYMAGTNTALALPVSVPSGRLCIYVLTSAHIVVDAAPWAPEPDTGTPRRLLDTRLTGPATRAASVRVPKPVGYIDPGLLAGTLTVLPADPAAPTVLTVGGCSGGPTQTWTIPAGAPAWAVGATLALAGDNRLCAATSRDSHILLDSAAIWSASSGLSAPPS